MRVRISPAFDAPVCIRSLRRERIALVFPLVRENRRDLTLDEWSSYAADLLAGERNEPWHSGITVAEQSNRCVVGMFSYFVRPCLRAGRVLAISDLVVAAPFGREIVARKLLAETMQLADRFGVRQVEIAVAQASDWWAGLLGGCGLKLDDRRRMIWRGAPSSEAAIAQPDMDSGTNPCLSTGR